MNELIIDYFVQNQMTDQVLLFSKELGCQDVQMVALQELVQEIERVESLDDLRRLKKNIEKQLKGVFERDPELRFHMDCLEIQMVDEKDFEKKFLDILLSLSLSPFEITKLQNLEAIVSQHFLKCGDENLKNKKKIQKLILDSSNSKLNEVYSLFLFAEEKQKKFVRENPFK